MIQFSKPEITLKRVEKVRAFATIKLLEDGQEVLELTGLRLIEKDGKLFVFTPSRPSNDGRHFDIYRFVSKARWHEVQKLVIDAYKALVEVEA